MKASELVKELNHIIEGEGDFEVSISCSLPKGDETAIEQGYLVSSPTFVVVDEYEGDAKEIQIRDWPY